MATLAAIFERPVVAEAENEWTPQPHWSEPDLYRLRPLPCEDVYLYSKKIDNSRLVRESDPASNRRCVRAVSLSLVAAIAVILLMLPNGLGIAASYQISALDREHDRLVNQKTALEVDEARLLSPERLDRLARQLRMVDPDQAHVVFLGTKSDTALAMNVRPKR
jgi:cell division protein FtsL